MPEVSLRAAPTAIKIKSPQRYCTRGNPVNHIFVLIIIKYGEREIAFSSNALVIYSFWKLKFGNFLSALLLQDALGVAHPIYSIREPL